MDLGLYDEEGAMRQRYLDLDDRTDETKERIANSAWGWTSFEEMYTISWVYHENGLEGVVLTYPEIKSAVDNKIISDVSLLPTYHEIKNQKTCIDLVRERALQRRFSVNLHFLKDLHAKLTRDLDQVGLFRRDIPIHRTYFHEIAQPTHIEHELTSVLDYLKTRPEHGLHPVELAANVHHRFMRVFPFSGTSGMIGRLLLNFVLLRHGYIPVIIHASDRQQYYEALRGTEREFRGFLAAAMENALDNAVRFLATEGSRGGSGRRAVP